MDCPTAQTNLSAYLRGDLPLDQRSALVAHLRGCRICLVRLAAVDPLASVLVQTETPPVPSGFERRVLAAARSRRSQVVAVAWSPLRWWRMASAPMHAAAAAVLVVGLAAGLALGWAARPATRQAQEDSQAMALTTALAAYNLDYLGDAPGGSLADSYLALLTNRKGGRQ